jgi:predicted metal-dependent enzyme (double-stranded beta helix superfamily)
MIHSLSTLAPLHTAIRALQALCERPISDADWLSASEPILRELLKIDTWLPETHAASHPQFYQQHALHLDPANRFSLSSFVWGPSQGTPVHDHTIAGWVGVLRGAELCQRYSADGLTKLGKESRLNPGDVGAVSPSDDAIGDVHTVRNAFDDRTSVSIHLYRGNIAGTPRCVFKGGEIKPFVSGYSDAKALV